MMKSKHFGAMTTNTNLYCRLTVLLQVIFSLFGIEKSVNDLRRSRLGFNSVHVTNCMLSLGSGFGP